MATALKIVDETPSGETIQAFTLHVVSERISARELIERRLRLEVDEFNRRQTGVFEGLVEPRHAERVLNGYKIAPGRIIDPDEQIRLAFRAFQHNGFIMLADDDQIEDLDQEIVLTPDLRVTFIKLIPLVGG